ncbi:MAG: exosome complex exonuclease Rrp41 [Candidatus Bathyarchaeia archaeon]
MMQKQQKLIDENGIRIDGRKWNELRPIKIQVGLLANANGSAYIEQGKSKILAAVYGPREAHPKHLALPNRAAIRCRYHMAPFSTEERKSPAPSRREIELSKVIREALEPTVFPEYYPRSVIDVFIEVLQSDGGTRCTGITAASLALADAGVPLSDLIAACAVGKVDGQLVLDMCDEEDKYGQGDLPIAYMTNSKRISLLQMDGDLTPEEFEKGLNLGVESCSKINEMQRAALKQRYLVEKESLEKNTAKEE